jgi:cytochrome c biogenesis protein
LSSRNGDTRTEGGAANGGAPQAPRRPRLVDIFPSVRLTLWLLAILAIAMAVATLIPQGAPEEAYLKVFGTLLGPLIARTTLHNIYGSWWFVGAFALLAVNLLACSIRRTKRLLAQDRAALARAADEETPRGRQARWRIPRDIEAAAEGILSVLSRSGYAVTPLPEANGWHSIVARRGRLSLWAPVISHVGLTVVLIGAAWGRLPSHTYRAVTVLGPGEVFPVKAGDEAFGLRLNDAGVEHDSQGKDTRYWAKVDVLEEGQVMRSQTVQPNRPLRYHGISVVLQSIMPAGFQVEVSKGDAVGAVPVVVSQDGQVDMMASIRKLEDPPWIVFVHSFRERDDGGDQAPAARVFVDRSGTLSHNWQLVGWVGPDGLDYQGVHFTLVPGMSGAQLSLDRDIGVPIVYLGFIIISLGVMLMLGSPHRRVTASISARGKGVQLSMSFSPATDQGEAERLWKRVESELGGVREANTS